MADNPYVNKVIYGNNTLIDLTSDTVTSSSLISGVTAHDRSGAPISGSFDPSRYVEKAGDTMTGDLSMHNDADIHLENGEITFQNEELDSTLLQPSETAYGDHIALKDANGYRIGYLIASVDANDTHGIIISATREDLNTPVYHGVGLYCDSSGNPSVYINEPASWRNALGLGNTSGALPIANGGTGDTGVITKTKSDVISSYGTNFNDPTAVSYCQWGKVAMLQITISVKTAIAAKTSKVACTLNDAYKPKITAPATMRLSANDMDSMSPYTIYITASGNVTLYAQSQLPSGLTIYINSTYILA